VAGPLDRERIRHLARLISLTEAHLSATLALMQTLGYDPRQDLAWLRRRTLDDPTCLPELLLLAEDRDRLVGFCLACLRGAQGAVKLFGVRDEARRLGLATALFDEIESRLRALGATRVTVGGVPPNYFEPGVSLVWTDSISFLLHRGYDTDRVARVNMRVDLARADLNTAADEARLAGEGIAVRRATAEEVPAIAAMARARFSEGWAVEASAATVQRPISLFAAWAGDEVVSFAAYDVAGPGRFGPTGTLEHYRRQGIGGVLLKRCLASMRGAGIATADILWAGPIGYYARAVDARIHQAFWVFEKPL
jgi:mycothiol synthase